MDDPGLDVVTLVRTGLAVAITVALAVVVLRAYRVAAWWAPAYAVAQGAAQLAVLALVLGAAIGDLRWVAAAVLVMIVTATVTAVRRLGSDRIGWVAGAVVAGAVGAPIVVFATGALALEARYVLALGGIVVGGAMTATTLAGRRLRAGLDDNWPEVEAWIALGATGPQATARLRRSAVYEALVPSLDQTRTTGLVTLPGAFVGAIFGGLSPVEAGRFQVLVLAALVLAGTVAATVVVTGLGRDPRAPAHP